MLFFLAGGIIVAPILIGGLFFTIQSAIAKTLARWIEGSSDAPPSGQDVQRAAYQAKLSGCLADPIEIIVTFLLAWLVFRWSF